MREASDRDRHPRHATPPGRGQRTRPHGGELTYDAVADRYSFTWTTHKGWASGAMACRELWIQLRDGSIHSLLFRFRTPS